MSAPPPAPSAASASPRPRRRLHLLIGNTGTHAYSQSLYKRLLYNAAADFTPVGLVSDSPRILLARKDLPVSNLQEFIAYAKANQDKMQFGSAGVGSDASALRAVQPQLGVNVTHVPYRGAGPVMQDLIGGRIDYICDTIQTGAQQAKQGTVKGIAVMARKRVPIIAELATTGEQGLAGVEASVWNAFFLPKDAGADRAEAQPGDERHARQSVDPQAPGGAGLEIMPPERRSPEYLAKYLPEEIERWAKPIREAGISAD